MFWIRTLSGAGLVALLIASILFGNVTLILFSILVTLIGLYEFLSLEKLDFRIMSAITYIFTVAFFVFLGIFQDKYTFHLISIYIIVLAIIYVLKYPEFEPKEFKSVVFAFLYIAFMFSFVYRIRTLNQGEFYVWLVFIAAWGTDTMAYLTGMFFGKNKLSPVLSPKKSVEGAIGGIVGSMILTLIYMTVVINVFANQFTVNRILILLCGIIAVGLSSVVSQFGDLFASAFKRYHDIKDYGNILPGHGGVLDRFDSVLFTAPLIYIVFSLIA